MSNTSTTTLLVKDSTLLQQTAIIQQEHGKRNQLLGTILNTLALCILCPSRLQYIPLLSHIFCYSEFKHTRIHTNICLLRKHLITVATANISSYFWYLHNVFFWKHNKHILNAILSLENLEVVTKSKELTYAVLQEWVYGLWMIRNSELNSSNHWTSCIWGS